MNDQVVEFEWGTEDTVIEPQKETAVYYNVRGDVVIRQKEDDGDDHIIVIQPRFLQNLIDALVAHRSTEER